MVPLQDTDILDGERQDAFQLDTNNIARGLGR